MTLARLRRILPAMPDADPIAAETELHELLIEIEALRPRMGTEPQIMKRYAMGKRVEAIYDRISELYGVIANTEAETQAGVAVKLRRALANVDDGVARKLVASALVTVEAMA